MNPDSPMGPDRYQQAWHAQSSQARVKVDASLLLKEVQRSQQEFRAMIFARDFREVGVALLLLPVWFYMGYAHSLPWSWYLSVPAMIWVGGFILLDRKRHPQTPVEPDKPLRESVKESLIQVEHQIWLLRNVFWWYLLPLIIPILAFFADVAWSLRSFGWAEALIFFVLLVGFVFAMDIFIYYLNQRAVRVTLEPRREELLKLLASLADETTSELRGEYPILMSAKRVECSPRLLVVTMLCFILCLVVLLSIGFAIIHFASRLDHPEKSPFAAVPWQQSQPERSEQVQPTRSSVHIDDAEAPFTKLIVGLRKENDLVGLAAMVVVDGKVVASAADGERKLGSGVWLAVGDRWHLGGITKSITATMIARLVESGQMKWSDSIGEFFREASVHQDWKAVTLKQLLTDTAGAPANFSPEVTLKRPAPGPECTRARRAAVQEVIATKPANPPGEKFAYSNVGFTIAAAMAEKATGATWEDLVKREVFEPQKLTGAGFGPPKSPDKTLEQPRGHGVYLGRKVSVADEADNTPIVGPSGRIHMTLGDLCTYATEHLRGDLGEGKLLSAETFKLLHTPEFNHYAYGWIRKEPGEEIPYIVYWHNGSNTMWYALVVFIPKKNMVVAVTSNDGDIEKAQAAAWEIVKTSVKQQFNVGVGPPGLEQQQHPR
jgi:CubicO group peptidase (beta-lactamase class C family)